MRLIFGITHDKLETSSPDVFYKFPSGGTQLTFLLDKNLNTLIKGVFKELDFETVNLIFNFDVSAGFFMGLANVYADIRTPDSTIKSEKAADYIWQDDKPGINVWGWQVATSFEVGGVLGRKHIWKHLGITVGAKTMFEGLYTGTDVLVNNVPGYRLRMCNYGLFFVGPVLNIKILNF